MTDGHQLGEQNSGESTNQPKGIMSVFVSLEKNVNSYHSSVRAVGAKQI